VRLTESGWEAGTKEEKAGEVGVLRVSEEEVSSDEECDSEEEEETPAKKKVKLGKEGSQKTLRERMGVLTERPFVFYMKTLTGKTVSLAFSPSQ
jgi:hypothetical protein